MRAEVSSIKDLPDTHRMGHTCANLNGDLFFIWGGSNENTAHLASRNNHLWIYETLTGYWRHRTCSGECPPNLSGATSALIGQKMYIFGGHSSVRENWLNAVYCLNLEKFVWKDLGLLSRGEPSKPIKCDKCVSWSYNKRLYVFGGYGWSQIEHLSQLIDAQRDLQLTPDPRWPRFGWNNQLVEFDPADNTWRWPSYTGQCPSARAAHSGAILGDTYFLFGGRDSHERLNDLYSLNMKTFQWTQIIKFSTGAQLERPIRHLLEEQEEQEEDANDEQDQEQANNANNQPMSDDEDMELVDEGEQQRDENEEEQEHLIPSPSSSMQHNRNFSADPNKTSFYNEGDDDDDDNEPLEYPLPSQLLERWSLSSVASQQSVAGAGDGGSGASSGDQTDHCRASGAVTTATADNSQPGDLMQFENNNNQTAPRDQVTSTNNSIAVSGDVSNDNNHHQLSHLNHNNLLINPGSQSIGADQEDHEQRDAVDDNTKKLDNNREAVPTGRSFGSFTQISDHDIMLYGGISSQDEVLNDCWLFNIKNNSWTQIDLKTKQQQTYPRLWHTGSCTKNNELIVIGGSNTSKIDHFCSDVLTIALEPKSLKRSALDAIAKSIRMRTINKVQGLPSTVGKLIKLRKQAIALTGIRRNSSRLPLVPPTTAQ